jgi:hypothetical protein
VHARERVADRTCRLDAVQDRHCDVHRDDVRSARRREPDRLGPVRRPADDVEAAVRIQQRLERVREALVVVDDQDAYRPHVSAPYARRAQKASIASPNE